MITAGGAAVGAVLMGGVFLFSTLNGGTTQPLPPAVSMPPSASADAYLCSSTCPGYVPPLTHYTPPPLVIGPPVPPPVIYIPVPVQMPVAARQTASQSSPKAQKQAGSKGAKASKPKTQKTSKAPKQPKAAKTTPAPVVVPTAPALPATVAQ